MECDDLKSPLCTYNIRRLQIPPSEIHLVLWEREADDEPQQQTGRGGARAWHPVSLNLVTMDCGFVDKDFQFNCRDLMFRKHQTCSYSFHFFRLTLFLFRVFSVYVMCLTITK